MKTIAYAIAGSSCIAVFAFAPGLLGLSAGFWSCVFFTALLLRKD